MSGKNTNSRSKRKNAKNATFKQQQANSNDTTAGSGKTSDKYSGRSNVSQDPNLNGSREGKSLPFNAQGDPIGCANLEEFSRRAEDLKNDINIALNKQTHSLLPDKPPIEVLQLRESILNLSVESAEPLCQPIGEKSIEILKQPCEKSSQSKADIAINTDIGVKSLKPKSFSSDSQLTDALDKLTMVDPSKHDDSNHNHDQKCQQKTKLCSQKKSRNQITNLKIEDNQELKSAQTSPSDDQTNALITDFEPLNAKLDSESKFVALSSSLQKHFVTSPELLESICRKMVQLSDRNDQLVINCHNYRNELEKSALIKQKLENLCRELQKSNNLIRIESLDLIKAEQSKAKDQTAKIQSTLSGVIKLFDENQQRNMNLRQENLDLQLKLKSLLEHCDNWEKSVSASLKQRDIENRLIKTELAKANLIKNEEREKFLVEKQELLRVLSLMQEQQHRIEGQEAKLRSDLSSYANKYDECQAVISKGMSKFQAESKRMFKQLEKSRQDYMLLLNKYEASNRRITKLLEEKQSSDRSLSVANKKIETLEKLCRALRSNPNVKLPLSGANESSQQIFEPQVTADGDLEGIIKQVGITNNSKNNSKESEEIPEQRADSFSSSREATDDILSDSFEHNDKLKTKTNQLEDHHLKPTDCMSTNQTSAEVDHVPNVDKVEVAVVVDGT